MKTQYVIDEYIDSNSNNLCEIFSVIVDNDKVYERDYGSVGSGIISYLEDYEQFYIEKNK